MSELELLSLVLAALYFWECLCWLRTESLALVKAFGRWRSASPGRLLGNHGGGFILAPLLPFGSVLVSAPYPLYLSPVGLASRLNVGAGSGAESQLSVIAWEELGEITAKGKRLFADGKLIARTNSVFRAHEMAEELRDIRKSPVKKREAAIVRLISIHFDRRRLHLRWKDFASRQAFLRELNCTLFALLLAVAPAAIWRFGLVRSWLPLVLTLIALTTGIAITFHRLHKHFYPALSDERFTHFLLNLLSPVTAIRSQDALTRPLLEQYHPVLLVCVFASSAEAIRVARPVLRSLAFAPSASKTREGAPFTKCRSFFLAAQREALEKLLRQSGIKPEELIGAPVARDSECRSYCPRCEAQFTRLGGECPDCGQGTLVPLLGNI
jgi:hypothetical protein